MLTLQVATQAFKALQEAKEESHPSNCLLPWCVSLQKRQFPQPVLFTAGCNSAWMAGPAPQVLPWLRMNAFEATFRINEDGFGVSPLQTFNVHVPTISFNGLT